MLKRIVSGGQTGVDRAALDVAMKLNLDCGGWCPKGRLDEISTIPARYNALIEITGEYATDQENFNARTIKNIIDSDGALIIAPCWPLPENIQDGTVLTIKEIMRQDKPYYILNLESYDLNECVSWMKDSKIETLNVAGPRESSSPGIYSASECLFEELILTYQNTLNFRK